MRTRTWVVWNLVQSKPRTLANKHTWWCFIVFRHRKHVTLKACQFQVFFQLLTSSAPRARHFWVHLMNSACMGHFWQSRGEIGDMSIAPFGVDVAAWIHSHKGSKMWSIGPRDVRHEHCFWWSPGSSNSKFVNKRVSQVVKSELPGLAISIEHPLLYKYERYRVFLSRGWHSVVKGC